MRIPQRHQKLMNEWLEDIDNDRETISDEAIIYRGRCAQRIVRSRVNKRTPKTLWDIAMLFFDKKNE
ncbi:hypothetical protein ACFQY8_06655 [Alloscardovia venturai]|uniref:Uncharacterized protein n=1 Tax=Alloscardovia venturai TaxID=1769421 RepID=A0ABW2YBC3_9BIFI